MKKYLQLILIFSLTLKCFSEDRWKLENSLNDAKADFKAGTVKLKLTGTIACMLTGLNPDEVKLVKKFPKETLACGCDISGEEIEEFRRKVAYATHYNQTIVSLVLAK